MIDLENYLSKSDAKVLIKKQSNGDKIQNLKGTNLLQKKVLLLTSIFLGLLGVDRFIMGDKKIAICKFVAFIALLVTIIGFGAKILMLITAYYGVQSGFVLISMTEGIEIFGSALYWTEVSLLSIMGVYVMFWICDIFICYKTNIKRNYKTISKQLSL